MDCGSRNKVLAAAVGDISQQLPIDGEAGTAILLPAFFRRFGAEGLFLSITDHAQAIGSDPCLNERLLDGVGAALAERQVVLIGTALVAVAADQHLDVGVLSQICRGLGERSLCIAANIVA